MNDALDEGLPISAPIDMIAQIKAIISGVLDIPANDISIRTTVHDKVTIHRASFYKNGIFNCKMFNKIRFELLRKKLLLTLPDWAVIHLQYRLKIILEFVDIKVL